MTEKKLEPAGAGPAPSPEGFGLHVDMLDVDRLRLWANRFADYGPNVTEWGSVEFVVEKLRDVASRLEQEVRDVGALRRQNAEWAEALSGRPAAPPPVNLVTQWRAEAQATRENMKHYSFGGSKDGEILDDEIERRLGTAATLVDCANELEAELAAAAPAAPPADTSHWEPETCVSHGREFDQDCPVCRYMLRRENERLTAALDALQPEDPRPSRKAAEAVATPPDDPEIGKSYPRVKGRCPSCHAETLFRGHGGYITCSVLGCKDPAAAHDLLAEAVATPPAPPAGWMVVRKREMDPPEVWKFDSYDDAAMFWDKIQANWTEVYFCRIAYGPEGSGMVGERPRFETTD